jgi:hypothetical protein
VPQALARGREHVTSCRDATRCTPNTPKCTLKMPALCQVCGPQRGYIPYHRMAGMGGEQHGRGLIHMADMPVTELDHRV